MGYKIDYSPEYTKIELSDRKVKRSTLVLFFMAGLLVAGILLVERGEVISAVAALEQMAAQIKQGGSVVEAFGSFAQALQGVIGG